MSTSPLRSEYDLVIVGTGMGGGTLAYALRQSGLNILLVERGDFLPREAQNWDPAAVFAEGRYKSKEVWYDNEGVPFTPGIHYFVGGNTKVYGAALPRLRREDFAELEHEEGISPAWPITYEELEPYYAEAEKLYRVHGQAGADPTDPPRSSDFPFPPVAHEGYIEDLCDRLRHQGLHPFYLPMGVDLRTGGACIRCATCDGFPCQVDAKSDADVCAIRQAVAEPKVELLTRTFVRRLLTDASGEHVVGLDLERDGQPFLVGAGCVAVCCAAVNYAALLVQSATKQHPNGLANSSGLVGRNYMVHNNTALMAVHPTRINPTVFQKTAAVNDFYLQGENGWKFPLGNIQLLGKLQAGMLTANQPLVPRPILRAIAKRSIDWWVMSEDLPDPDNRITLREDGGIQVRWKPTNSKTHERLVRAARRMLQRAGYPIVLTQRMGIATNSHQCGTLRFGRDAARSLLDRFCRAHDLSNLLVVDSSFFSSSTAVNPALTIAAQALRVADRILSVRRFPGSFSVAV